MSKKIPKFVKKLLFHTSYKNIIIKNLLHKKLNYIYKYNYFEFDFITIYPSLLCNNSVEKIL